MVFKLFQLNTLEKKGKILNQLMLSINQQNIQKLNLFAIIQMIFQKAIQMGIQLRIKQTKHL